MKKAKKYELVVNRVMELIEKGVIKDGDKIASVRSMAKQMNLSIMTVLEGYRRLEAKGVVESLPRSGYIVRPKAHRKYLTTSRLPEAREFDIEIRPEKVKIPDMMDELFEAGYKPDIISFGAGFPLAEDFPSEALSLCLARVARTYPFEINQYSLNQGDLELRKAVLNYMVSAGCTPALDEISITPGTTQGMMTILRILTSPGEIVAVESPGYFGFYSLLEMLNLQAVEVPANPQRGISVDYLQALLDQGIRPKCLVLSSNFSNPTGALMPDENKRRLVELCRGFDLPIVEDDTYGDLYFSEKRPRPLKAFDPENVVYLGNFSKTVAPGYRVAWIAPGKWNKEVNSSLHAEVVSTPLCVQKAMAEYLNHGGVRQHVRRLRKKYEQHIEIYQKLVAQYFPEGTRTGNPRGGHFLWVEMPRECDSLTLGRMAMKEGISIAPGTMFSARQVYKNCMRLNCAMHCGDEVVAAIRRLGELAKSLKIYPESR